MSTITKRDNKSDIKINLKEIKSAKLHRFKDGIKKSKFDSNLDNYRLMGKLKLLEDNVSNKGNIKNYYEGGYNFINNGLDLFYIESDKRLEENLKHKNLTIKELLEAKNLFSDNNGTFKCLCKQCNIRNACIIKHRDYHYYIITGLNCYKAIRGEKYYNNNCIKCDILLNNKKLFCDKCINEIKQNEELKLKKIETFIYNKKKLNISNIFKSLKNYIYIKKYNRELKIGNKQINFGKYKNYQIDYLYNKHFNYINKCVLDYQNNFEDIYKYDNKYDDIVKYYIIQQKKNRQN